MAIPEAGPPAGERRNLLEILKEILKKIFGDKQRERNRLIEDRRRKEAEQNQQEEENRDRKNEEIRRKREEEKREKIERETKKAYHDRRSAQDRVSEEDLTRARKVIHNKQAGKIKEQVEKVLEQPEPPHGKITSGYEQAYFLFSERFKSDPNIINGLNRLIEENPRAASVIERLTERDNKVNTDPARLLEIGKLLNINTPSELHFVIEDIMSAINTRIKNLITKRVAETQQNYAHRDIKEDQVRKIVLTDVSRQIDPYITNEEKTLLNDWDTHQEAIDQILSSPGPSGEVMPVDVNPILPDVLPEAAVTNIDKVWEKVEQAQRAGKILSIDELDDVRRDIYEKESESYPKDVFPGTEEYLREVNAVHKHTEERLNQLAEMARDKLRTEGPPIKTGITDAQEFLLQMVESPGRVGDLLLRNQTMYKLFIGPGKESYQFRNQVFLRIHGAILTQKRESSQENFGLYERADFTSFISLIRHGLSGITVPDTGKSVGQTWADWYTSLSTTIRLSRDIDFWASQPAASIDNFNKSLAMFQNEYSVQALTMPAVEQAYRAYETALMTIRDANDGYLPPSLIEYDSVHNTIYWDQWAQDILVNKMIPQGAVRDSKRDFERMGGLPLVNPDGVTVAIGDKLTEEDLKKDPEKLEMQMYMTLAKGFGMASMRFLEIVANSKIPGVEAPGFHSPVYEGAAYALNYWNIFIKKWSAGAYKYFHAMNTILPHGKRMPVDSKGAEKAYQAALDGTFDEKYGEEARRMMDILNFDRSTGAFSEFTPWRYFDATLGWSDRQRQLMGGPARVIFAHRFAEAKVKEHLVEEEFKEAFRRKKRELGQPDSGSDFETLWQNEGKEVFGNKIEEEWKHLSHDENIQNLIKNYERAFKSRVWIETALRSPQTIAHIAKLDFPIPGFGKEGKKHRKLHNYIVERVLGITPEDIEYGTVEEGDGRYKINSAKFSSPTEEQRRKLKEIFDLEGDMMSVRELAMAENRELSDSDFDVIKNDARKRHAKEYWSIVKKFIMGNVNADHNKIFKDLGIELNWDNYEIDWNKIRNADSIINSHAHSVEFPFALGQELSYVPKAFEDKFLNKEWEWIEATDDTAFRQMDLLNLGARQWVRRGGDVAAHFQGSQLVASYLQDELTSNPDPAKLAEALMKIRQSYQGDDINVGYRVAGAMAYLTGKLYEFDYKRLGSSAQLDVWNTRRNVAGWLANGRRAYWDAIEHMDIIPPHAHFETWAQGPNIKDVKFLNIHELRHQNHADNGDVWIEIITLGILLATAITLWRAFTAKSEEEESGGGGQ